MMATNPSKNRLFFARRRMTMAALMLMSSSQVMALDAIGIHSHFNHYPDSSDTYLAMIKQFGFNSFRSDLAWNSIESQKGVFSINDAGNQKEDLAFQTGFSQYGLSALMVLGYGNKLYSNNAIDFPRTPEQIAAFANYAAWIAARYKGKVKYFDIWNEWLYGTGLTSKPRNVPPAQVYFDVVKATSAAVRKVDPNAVILAGSFNTNKPRDVAWFEELMKLGILNYIDGVSIHPYSLKLPEDNLATIDKFEELAKRYAGKEVPVYITEMGQSSSTAPGYVSDDATAQFVVKYTFLAKARPYIKGLWWYDLVDDGPDVKNREHRFGFVTQSNQPKSMALQFQKIAEVARDYKVERYQTNTDGNVSISLSHGGKYALLAWQQTPVQAQAPQQDLLKSVKSFVKMEGDKSEGAIRMIDPHFQGQSLYEEKSALTKNYGNVPVLVQSDKPIAAPQ
ncbi:glycoside hydrolase family 5 protein [Serratia marcescens]|uniref:glycoside hydrolase family 5 protein n=1 Tax=Serratia marcescens TaxID=615 RepID=UPI00214AD590|nr:glycoside hydrolase family 5 protein [Serratia marcescens]